MATKILNENSLKKLIQESIVDYFKTNKSENLNISNESIEKVLKNLNLKYTIGPKRSNVAKMKSDITWFKTTESRNGFKFLIRTNNSDDGFRITPLYYAANNEIRYNEDDASSVEELKSYIQNTISHSKFLDDLPHTKFNGEEFIKYIPRSHGPGRM